MTVLSTLYQAVKWFVANISKIWSVFQSIVGALQAALSGDLASKIAKAVENALAAAIVPVLDMFARLAGIGDVPRTIRDALKKLKMKAQAPVRKVLNKVGEAIQKLWNEFLALFGLKGANAVPEPDEWGQTNENKLWSEAGNSMITMSPGQRLDQALKDAVANGADPARVKPCQDLMQQHQSITGQITAGVKQPQTRASAQNIVMLKGQAAGVVCRRCQHDHALQGERPQRVEETGRVKPFAALIATTGAAPTPGRPSVDRAQSSRVTP